MFKREREIWSDPYADKRGDEIPEMVYRVNDALRIISELFHSDLTDAELLDRGIDPDIHHLYMEGHRHDYVDRLVREREMFEEIAMREMEQMY